MGRRVVIVGHGMVGARFAEEVRRRDPDGRRVRLTVLGAEPRPAYNRVLLSTVLGGGLPAQSVQLHPPGWAGRHRVELCTGVTAVSIDRTAREVHCSDGPPARYDELVLATGSRAWLPPLAGMDDERVVTFRDLADCERILALARPGARFAVLGGGLLGCEAARGLAARGVRVTVVHSGPHLMERQLDAGAGEVLAATMARLGVDVRLGFRAVTRLKARDVDLATVGDPATLEETDAEVLRFADPTGGRYATLALRGDRVVGGAVIGLPEAAASMIQYYDTGQPVPTDRLGLLFGRALPGATATSDPGRIPATAVVCRCNTVTKGALVAVWRAGHTDVSALSRATRAGTGCGSCGDAVRGICAWLAESDPPTLTPVPEEGAA